MKPRFTAFIIRTRRLQNLFLFMYMCESRLLQEGKKHLKCGRGRSKKACPKATEVTDRNKALPDNAKLLKAMLTIILIESLDHKYRYGS